MGKYETSKAGSGQSVLGLIAVAVEFIADGGDFGPQIVDRRLEIGRSLAGWGVGRIAGIIHGGLGRHRLIGAGIYLFDKMADIHPLLGVKFAQFAQEIGGGFLEIFGHQFGHGASEKKRFHEGIVGGVGTAIHREIGDNADLNNQL
jgi:hypothetical protein